VNAHDEPEQLPIPFAANRKNSVVGPAVQPAAVMSLISAWSCASERQTDVSLSVQPLAGSGLVSVYDPPKLEL
jgi:hypothetical protein